MNTFKNYLHKKRGIRAQVALVSGCSLFVLVIGCGGSGGGTKTTGSTTVTGTTTATTTGTATASTATGTATGTTTGTATATATGTSTSTGTSTATGGTGSTAGGVAPHYHITAMTNLAGHYFMNPTSINASGQVVGYSYSNTNSSTAAVIWNPTTSTLTDLSGGTWTQAVKINNSGLIVGNAYDPNTGSTTGPVYWNAGSTTPTSATVGSLTRATFAGLNNSGNIVGNSLNSSFMVNIGSLTNPATISGAASVTAINDQNQIVGSMAVQQGHTSPAYWSSATASPTGMADVAFSFNSATAINPSGQIIGIDGETADFWASATGAEVDLGFGRVGGINASGTVVGAQQMQGVSGFLAFIYSAKTGVVNLNTLLDSASVTAGWTLTNATVISDSGVIYGIGMIGATSFTFIAQPLTS